FRYSKGATKIEIAFSTDECVAQWNIQSSSDRTEGHAGASNQCFQEHVARTHTQSIASCCRVKTGLDQRSARFDATGNAIANPSLSSERDQRFLGLFAIAVLNRCL